MTHFFEFWDPLIAPGRMKLETSYLAPEMDCSVYQRKNEKLGQRGSRGGHVTHFLEFWDFLISPDWLKLETSNLAQRCMAESANEKMQI